MAWVGRDCRHAFLYAKIEAVKTEEIKTVLTFDVASFNCLSITTTVVNAQNFLCLRAADFE